MDPPGPASATASSSGVPSNQDPAPVPHPPLPPPPPRGTTVPADPLRVLVDLQQHMPAGGVAPTASWSSSRGLLPVRGRGIGRGAAAGAGSSSAGARGESGSGVMKVNQVDAHVLDSELLDLLRIQLGIILAPPFFPPGSMDRFKPELNALLDFLLFRFTIFRNEPTPGMRMQNLRFVDGRGVANGASAAGAASPRASQRLLLGLLCIGGKWGFARLRRHALVAGWADEEQQPPPPSGLADAADHTNASSTHPPGSELWKRWVYKALDRAESLFRLAWLINFLVFLRYGRYPSLLQRLTGMRLVYHDALGSMSRSINFQFMNRQLLWEHFTQLALCVVPLVDWDALRRQVSGLIRQRRLGAAGGADGGAGIPGAGGADGDMECVVCGETEAQTPYVTDCGHVYCYYCLKTACLQDDNFACPRCGTFFATSKRWAPGQ